MTWGPPGKAVYTPLELFELLGPCPRQCIHFSGTAKTPAGPKADLRNMYESSCISLFLNVSEVLHTVCNRAPPPDFFDHEDLEYVLFLYNAHPTNPSRTPAFNYDVPTLFLRQMLTEHLRSAHDTGRWTAPRIAATVLDRAPSLAAAFYQPLLIEHLLETRAGRFCNILEPDGDGATAFTVRLGPGLALSYRALDLDPGTPMHDHDIEVIEDECILVPRTGCDAFDAVVVSEGRTRVTLLRSAVCAPGLELDINTDAIRAAIDVFDSLLPHPETVRWSFVYAALDGDRAKTLAERDVARQTSVGVDPRLRVGWMKIATLERSARALLVSPIAHYYIMEGLGDAHGLNRTRSRREEQKRRLVKSGLQRDSDTVQRIPKHGQRRVRSRRKRIGTRTAGPVLMAGWRGRTRIHRHVLHNRTCPHEGAYSRPNVREFENVRCIRPNTEQTVHRTAKLLVRRSVGEGRGREADAAVRDVEHVVEPLEERHAVDEVEPFPADAADVVHDQEHRVRVTADRRVELHWTCDYKEC